MSLQLGITKQSLFAEYRVINNRAFLLHTSFQYLQALQSASKTINICVSSVIRSFLESIKIIRLVPLPKKREIIFKIAQFEKFCHKIGVSDIKQKYMLNSRRLSVPS